MASERETRKEIDKQLKQAGWDKGNGAYIKEEVNTVKSDFVNKDFVLFDGKVEKGVDKFIDYLLLADDHSPLAIIEAKEFSKNPEKGRIQARTYAIDIENQTGTKPQIFLTNSEKWIYIDQNGLERQVSGIFSQDDLKRRAELHKAERDPSTIHINEKIVDRPKTILNLRKLSEHFAKRHRKALVQMATGTGKTRLAMGLIDLLINANKVRNVLFIADRIALADQANSDGFKKYFKEPIRELHREGFSTDQRLYTTTVQTLIGKGKERMFQKFSPGYFDLIIFDEAHRSLYDKNNTIFKYFDAIKIGLTATPKDVDDKNTYKLFDCEDGKPTVDYSYQEAINDQVLVPYEAQVIETEVLGLGIEGKKLTPELKAQLRAQGVDPEHFDVKGKDFDRVFMDDKTNELIIREYIDRCYKSEDNLPCKTIFFCASQKHANFVKRIFTKLYPNLSSQVQVITSDEYRAIDEILRFKNSNEPRIALSVGMLDTGVDIPEVCNLVFVKPVYEKTRFWQMIGRGTRNINACKHPEWLPERQKQNFRVLDFAIGGHSNIKYHKFSESKKSSESKSMATKIFLERVNLLNSELDEKQKKLIVEKILTDLKALDEDSFIVREKLTLLRKVKQTFELEKYIKELNEEIAPLLILKESQNANSLSFILQAERLFGYILKENTEKIEKVKLYVQEQIQNILRKENLNEIKDKKEQLIEVLQETFWDNLTFEKVEFLVKEIAPLMKYYEQLPKGHVQIDMTDKILTVEKIGFDFGEDKLVEFKDKNPILKKIKSGEGITSNELLTLEKELTKLKPAYTIENVQKNLKKDFLTFIHEIIGLTSTYDPKNQIEKEFDKHIIQNNEYSSQQIEFLQVLKKVFANRKHIELTDFAKEPLSNERPLDIFQTEELEKILTKINKIKMK